MLIISAATTDVTIGVMTGDHVMTIGTGIGIVEVTETGIGMPRDVDRCPLLVVKTGLARLLVRIMTKMKGGMTGSVMTVRVGMLMVTEAGVAKCQSIKVFMRLKRR